MSSIAKRVHLASKIILLSTSRAQNLFRQSNNSCERKMKKATNGKPAPSSSPTASKDKPKEETPAPPAAPVLSPAEQVAARFTETVGLVKKSVETHDDSLVLRALRRTGWIRKQKLELVRPQLLKALAKSKEVARAVETLLPVSMEVEPFGSEEQKEDNEQALLPEVELYLHHLAIHIAQSIPSTDKQALLSNARLMIHNAKKYERRTMDVLRAKAWHAFSMVVEAANGGRLDETVRNEILAAHRNACLRLDEPGQAVTINLIMRDLVNGNLIQEAAVFAAKAKFPDRASNNMQVRHLYYMGRVEALQLEYGKALSLVQNAIRKTPTSCGKGFRLKLYQLATVVTLLTGETPERAWFSDRELGEALTPYFDLVKAVRVGHVHAFEQCVMTHKKAYERDRTLTLVQRLHSSVIKTGLKSIGAAYSKISFTDVAAKLELEGEDNTSQAALYLCAKAIRDGVLDASIDSDRNVLVSQEQLDIYSSTSDPQKAFQRRINFLLQVHNDAVKALRYPPNAHKPVNKPQSTSEDREADLDDLEDALGDDE